MNDMIPVWIWEKEFITIEELRGHLENLRKLYPEAVDYVDGWREGSKLPQEARNKEQRRSIRERNG